MSLGPDDLVLCAGTLPRGTPFRERCRAASAAGFAAISVWGRDYQSAVDEGLSDSDFGPMLADHGLQVAELDPAWWWTPGAAGVVIPPELDPVDVFRFGEDQIFHLADVVGARSLNAVDVFGGQWDLDEAAEGFAALCDRAAEHGLLVHLEWLAWSKIPTLEAAERIVALADRTNGGLNVDTWHCARSGTAPVDLLAVPPERVFAIQLDDGPAEPEADLLRATLHERRLPGEGAFDLQGYLDALRSTGVTAPLGVEVFSDELHDLGPMEAAARAGAATRSLLAAH
jgi:sugar phosphate isomerase/epimerase